jgi:outer membrane lipoprotein-sorting protein
MIVLASLLVAGSLSLQDGNEAKDLFDAMVKKIDAAKSVRVEFGMVHEQGDSKRESNGKLSLAEGNRMRLDFVEKSERGDRSVILISDGKTTVVIEKERNRRQDLKTPEKRGELVQGIVSRIGVLGGFSHVMVQPEESKDAQSVDDVVSLDKFQMEGMEKVDGRDTMVVKCIARISIRKDEAAIKVWIDPVTHLPLRRSIVPYREGKPAGVTIKETYAVFELDKEIPQEVFAIPAEEKKEKD